MLAYTRNTYLLFIIIALVLFGFVDTGYGQETAEEIAKISETSFIFNTLLFLGSSVLVLISVLGFSCLEAGCVKKKNIGAVLVKNILALSAAGIMFFVSGYNLMFEGVDGGFYGSLNIWNPDDKQALDLSDFDAGYASSADFLFQFMLVAFALMVISSSLGIRVKPLAFVIFSSVMAGFIFPVVSSWQWGGGWLSQMGFVDFAGSTLIHSVAGWAALSGSLIIGARKDRFSDERLYIPIVTNPNYVALGVFLIWIGWLGLHSGAQLAYGTASDAVDVSNIIVHTLLAGWAGMITASLLCQVFMARFDIQMSLLGLLGGMVTIAAEPVLLSTTASVLVGVIGGITVFGSKAFLDYIEIDDVTGAIPVHLGCGLMGTLVAIVTSPHTQIEVQLIGLTITAVFVFSASSLLWLVLRFIAGLRVESEEKLMLGA